MILEVGTYPVAEGHLAMSADRPILGLLGSRIGDSGLVKMVMNGLISCENPRRDTSRSS